MESSRKVLVSIVVAILCAGAGYLYVVHFSAFYCSGSKMPPARSDMMSLATVIEAYKLDHGVYPAMRPLREFVDDDARLRAMGGWDLSTIEPGRAGLAGVTTPVAYMTSHFLDPYTHDEREKRWPYAYFTDGDGWILISPGFDGNYDLTNPGEVYDSSVTQPSNFLIAGPWTYDPTNGAKSSGDIWRVRQ